MFINNNDFGWKADECKLTRNHENYLSGCQHRNPQSLAQVSANIAIEEEANKKEFGPKGGVEFEKALEKAQSWGKKYKNADDIPDE